LGVRVSQLVITQASQLSFLNSDLHRNSSNVRSKQSKWIHRKEQTQGSLRLFSEIKVHEKWTIQKEPTEQEKANEEVQRRIRRDEQEIQSLLSPFQAICEELRSSARPAAAPAEEFRL